MPPMGFPQTLLSAAQPRTPFPTSTSLTIFSLGPSLPALLGTTPDGFLRCVCCARSPGLLNRRPTPWLDDMGTQKPPPLYHLGNFPVLFWLVCPGSLTRRQRI